MFERQHITVTNPESEQLKKDLYTKEDVKSMRMCRLLDLPDLTRTQGSPIKYIVDAVLDMEAFKNFDVIEFPEIVKVRDNFDLLNAPADHPSRKETDTYYVDQDHVLRTQTTVMWPFYLQREEAMKELTETGEIGLLSYGKVFRKDEIDRNHYPVFHQVDGLYLCKKSKKEIVLKDLQDVLVDIATKIFGDDVEYKILDDTFPFTDPSTQIEIKVGEQWLEIVGAGIVHTQVLKNLDIDSDEYNGWAFGFGLERLAMVKMNVDDIRVFWSKDPRITSQFTDINSTYTEVSKYPMSYRDISFVVDKDMSLNSYFEIVRECGGDLIEQVEQTDTYTDAEKFGADKVSYTFRVVYRSPERTLTNEEVNAIQEEIIRKTKEELNAQVR
jgi:phenylalanyl-tRNA synthetase alpha chain